MYYILKELVQSVINIFELFLSYCVRTGVDTNNKRNGVSRADSTTGRHLLSLRQRQKVLPFNADSGRLAQLGIVDEDLGKIILL